MGTDMVTPSSEDRDRRRSQRIPLKMLLMVLSVDSYLEFKGPCYVTNVSYHGCQLIAPRPFKHETLLDLTMPSTNRHIRAHVIWSTPVGPEAQVKQWKVGVQFDTPGNYWALPFQPLDWLTAT